MQHYPVTLNLTGKRILVVGGGRIALRKLQGVVGTGAEIVVVAPVILPEIQALPDITIINRLFQSSDTLYANIIFAATDNPEVNHLVGQNLQNWQWFNNTGNANESDFYSPAVLRRADFVVAISTNNLNPVRAKQYKGILQSFFDGILNS